MKKILFLLIGLLYSIISQAQNINLTYKSARENYQANLENNIFNDLIFTDSKKNRITFNNKFLGQTNPTLLTNTKAQEVFFEQQMNYYKNIENRKEEFSIDILEAWIFKSNHNNYHAEIRKDIFSAQIFSDNKKNQITYDAKYLAKLHENPFRSGETKFQLFADLIDMLSQESGYRVRFEVNIFDKVIVTDNRGFKRESNDAYYILPEFNSLNNSKSTSNPYIIRISNQEFIYKTNRDFANLIQDRFKKWHYEDSLGNRFQIAQETWAKLKRIHQNEEAILAYFVTNYLNF